MLLCAVVCASLPTAGGGWLAGHVWPSLSSRHCATCLLAAYSFPVLHCSSVAVPSAAAVNDYQQSVLVPSQVANSATDEEPEMEEEEEEEYEGDDSPRSWPGTLPNRPYPTLNESFIKSITTFTVPNRAPIRAGPTPLALPFTTTLPSTLATAAAANTPMGMFLGKSSTTQFVHPMQTLFTIVPPGLIQPPPMLTSNVTTTTNTITPTTPEVHSPVYSSDETNASNLFSPTKISFDLTKPVAGKPVITLASIPPEEMTQAHIDLKVFAEDFKTRRIQLGYTQGAVGQSLAEKGYSNFAQSTISRFEQLQLSPSNAAAIRQVLERWLIEMENPTAVSPVMEPLAPARKRKRRAVYSSQTRQMLDEYFQKNCRPNRALIETIARELDLLPEEVRVWFCNKRQKSKHSYQSDEVATVPSPSSPSSSIYSQRTSPSPPSNFSIEELSKSSAPPSKTTFSPIQFTSHLSMLPPQMSTLTPIVISPTYEQMGLTFVKSPPTVLSMSSTA